MIGTAILRVIQILLLVAIFGLSIYMILTIPYYPGRPLNFTAFAAVWGLLVAILGLAGVFTEAIPRILLMVADGLAAIFCLAAGVADIVTIYVLCRRVSSALNAAGDDNSSELLRCNKVPLWLWLCLVFAFKLFLIALVVTVYKRVRESKKSKHTV